MNDIFRLIFYPFEKLPLLWGLVGISIVTGIGMLVVFRYTSSQKAIKQAKDRVKAHIFELFLYKDNLRIILKALVNILKYNGAYLKQVLIPLFIIIGPMILILVQLNFRYGYRPLRPNESVTLKLKLNRQMKNNDVNVLLDVPDAIVVETPVLRIYDNREFNWRVKGTSPGRYELAFFIEDERVRKSIRVSPNLEMVSPVRVSSNFFKMLFYPTENPLPHESKVESIEVTYPSRDIKIFNRNVPWIGIFFIVSVAAAFALKGMFKVEI